MVKSSEFGLHICHGGRFINKEVKQHYMGGEFLTKIGLDPDRFGYFDLVDYVKEIGYMSWENLYYRIPTTQRHIVIVDDSCVMNMLTAMGKNLIITVCVEGGVKATKVTDHKQQPKKMVTVKGNDVEATDCDVEGNLGDAEGSESDCDGEPSDGDGEGSQTEGYGSERQCGVEGQSEGLQDKGRNDIDEESNIPRDVDDWGPLDNATFSEIEDVINMDCWGDSSEEEYQPSESDLSEVSLADLDYISDEENIELRKKLKKVDSVFNLLNENDGFEADVEHTYVSDYENETHEFVSEESDSDFEPRLRKKRLVYDPKCDHNKLEIVIGMHFQDGFQCREALTTWAIENGRYIWFRAVSKKKLLAKCTPPCPWKVFASALHGNGNFFIKSYAGDHNCTKAMSNKLLSSQWVAKRYLNVYRVRYNLGVKDLGADILERFKVRVPKDRLYKARRLA
ncbi:uncharacterized protein LOC131012138 [Salvia miltiorrhiza]|uniref:uncharacterized protein LOC131012138 n=1 Tax=Salvia miltiorrhiza TaxID=226208 RepID=UPI0025AD2C8E|nr:uncharacterized protein LOC131012138 [Salvia miltiorrhiza]XP_057796035.1 uncharacterized protein LOC131012138 [Salvia miltiorrhiza]XP_057796036.1 uncharacterized protein LOC131012138 [Salvia miltiorrhiza]XP_057796037.1 uncharacterized protein LOC131012138 [Salvia miltiorrhiza]